MKPRESSLQGLTALSLSLLVLAFAACRLLRPIYWEDVWWHLGVGQYIVVHHHVPRTDVFSWTMRGAPWMNTEWLYEVILYGLMRAMGLSGVIFLKITLVFTALYFVDRRLRLWKASVIERLFFLGMAFLGGWSYWVERADLSSLALVSALFFTLDQPRGTTRRWPGHAFLWIILFMLWPNIHGAYPVGLVMIGLRGLFLLPEDTALGRRVLIWSFLCGAASLVNPEGIGLPIAIVRTFLHAHVGQIQENLPPQGWGYLFFYVSFGLTVASFALKKKWTSDDAYAVGITAIFAGFAFHLARFIIFFMLGAFPYAARSWLASPWRSALARRLVPWEKIALIVSCAALLMISIHGASGVQGGVDAAASGYVKGACDFIASQKVQGPFYNDYKFGSYWIWRFKGDPPVFQDGRHATVLGYDRLMDATLDAQRSPKTWNAYAERLGIQAALVKYPPFSSGVHPSTFDQFFPRTSWGLIYWDDLCLLFVRRTPRTRALLAQWEYRVIKPDWTLDSFLDQLDRRLLNRQALRAELERNLALNPACWRARVDLHWIEHALSSRKDL